MFTEAVNQTPAADNLLDLDSKKSDYDWYSELYDALPKIHLSFETFRCLIEI